MNAIIKVADDEGFSVGTVNQKKGIIVCKPRKMLNGVLMEKIQGGSWNVQTKSSTFNHRIQFSAHVSQDGVVRLRTLVMATDETHSVDREKSEKLTAYYQKKIMAAVRP